LLQKPSSEFASTKSAIDEKDFPYRKRRGPENEKIFYQYLAEVWKN
jgi:hypothetical protein